MILKNWFKATLSFPVLIQAWFSLTSRERMSLFVILGLIILGLCTRYWCLCHEKADIYPGPEIRRLMTADLYCLSSDLCHPSSDFHVAALRQVTT